jgi:hypothetical protein
MSADEAARSDEAALMAHAMALADAIDEALPGWIRRCVEQRCAAAGRRFDDAAAARAEEASLRGSAEVGPVIRRLLVTDIDSQTTTPLAVLRGATRYATHALADLGVPPVERDEFSRRAFPDDVQGLSPASFAEVDPALHEPGLIWGAAKAHVHLARRRNEGRR